MKSQDEKIAKMKFSSVYPHYVNKVEKKGRTEKELLIIIEWLTSFDKKQIEQLIEDKVTFEEFFNEANLHPNANLITGNICKIRVEDIETPLTQQVRYLDKIVDELAKGKAIEKIMRR